MNKNRTMYIINQGIDGVIRWAVVYVPDVSYDVYYRDRSWPRTSWRREDRAGYEWTAVVNFVQGCLESTNPALKVVRGCVVRKFIKENNLDG